MREFKPYVGPDAWGVYDWRTEYGAVHVVPEHDIGAHVIECCRCNTRSVTWNDIPIVIHSAFDGREAYEGIERGEA